MDAELRARFNRSWNEALAQRVLRDLERRLNCTIPFPLELGLELIDDVLVGNGIGDQCRLTRVF